MGTTAAEQGAGTRAGLTADERNGREAGKRTQIAKKGTTGQIMGAGGEPIRKAERPARDQERGRAAGTPARGSRNRSDKATGSRNTGRTPTAAASPLKIKEWYTKHKKNKKNIKYLLYIANAKHK